MLSRAFAVMYVVTQVEVATTLALNTYGTEVALVMVLVIMNLVFAKITPFKSVFLTGHFPVLPNILALVFIALVSQWSTLLLVVSFLVSAVLRYLSVVPAIRKQFFVGGDPSHGQFPTALVMHSGYVGKLFAKKNDGGGREGSQGALESSSLQGLVFRAFMIVLFYVVTYCMPCHHHLATPLQTTSHSPATLVTIAVDLALPAGLQFAAGMSVLAYGVRQFIADYAAFVGISEKLIPDARPAVDCPAIFPFAPNAVNTGFIGSFRRSCCNGTYGCIPQPNHHDSRSRHLLSAVLAAFVVTLTVDGAVLFLAPSWLVSLTAGPLVLYPAFAQLGIAEASFP